MSIQLSEEYYDRSPHSFSKITIGVVEHVDDELQQLRLYIRCPSLGDYDEKPTEDLPITFLMSPMMGESVYRDDGFGLPEGSTAYGLILPPRVGAQAIVACIDDNTDLRVCLGFINTDFIFGTFPNGRYTTENNEIVGPLTLDEYPLTKQNSYSSRAFGEYSSSNYEKISRCYDRPISKMESTIEEQIFGTVTKSDVIIMDNGYKVNLNQGYVDDPNLPGVDLKAATIYGLTTPMGNSWFMDDSPISTKIKLKTPKGTQIILDDTNERIYVNTAEGNSWFEMDYDGHVDLFCYNLNAHATNDINLTSDNNLNIKSKNINIVSTETCKIKQNVLSIDTTTDSIFSSHTLNETITNHINKTSLLESSVTTYKLLSNNMNIETSVYGLLSDSLLLTGNSTNITGSGSILMTGGSIHMNGPSASTAEGVDVEDPLLPTATQWTKRRPDHEPWPRMSFADNDTNHTILRFALNDPKIGKENIDNLMAKSRNAFWRR